MLPGLRPYLRWILIFLTGGLAYLGVVAQAPSSLSQQVFNITRFSTDEGLAQSQVITLLQDSKGYLWLGTHRGLDRFDGHTFTHFGPEEGMQGTFLNDLMEDRQGNIWILSDVGINYFDGASFKLYTLPESLPIASLTCFAADSTGGIWLGTNHQGLWFLQDGQCKPAAAADSLSQTDISSLWEDANGHLWIGSRQGLFHQQQDTFVSVPQLDGMDILAIHESSPGEFYFGTTNGLFSFEQNQLTRKPLPKQLDDPRVFCMATDRIGRLWLGTGNGVGYLKESAIIPLRASDGLLRVRMTDAMLDREGNIWFGTDGGGIRKITEGVFASYGIKDGFSSNLAKSFLEDSQGRIWVSTKDRGINVFDGQRVVRQYHTRNSALGGDDICYSYKDSKGHFWFASYNGTLTRFDGQGFEVIDEADGLTCTSVYCIVEHPVGQYWIGTDQGIYFYKNGNIQGHLGAEAGFPSNTIYQLLPDQNGGIWVGTAGGLAYGRRGALKLEQIEDSLFEKNVITLAQDPAGRVWVGSSQGLAWVEGKDVHPVRVSGAPGAHTIVSLAIDPQHNLWVATENGAYKLQLDTLDTEATSKPHFEHYTQKDGLPSLECNANAIFVDRQQNLWLGTAEGAIKRPNFTMPRVAEQAPTIYITRVQGKRPSDWTKDGQPLGPNNLPQNLVLPYSQNRVTFDFTGISLRSPKQVEYRVKLIGLDDDWQKVVGNSIFYPNLKPGKYTFLVTAKLETEPWNYDRAASFSFTIESPFYQTWWFILLAILVTTLGVWFFVYTLMSRRQQAREKQRIRNTAEKLQLEHQALYAMMNPHFTFNALQSIQNFIQQNDKKSAHKFLARFAKLVRKNLDSTKADFITLNEEVERLKLYLGLEKMRFPEKFDYKVEMDPDVDAYEITIPPMLLQPFVENSIKHGIMPLVSDGLISIHIQTEPDDYMRIQIKDNGIGIEASKAMKRDRPNDHVSKGMQITQDRLALFARMTEKDYALDIKEIAGPDGKVVGTMVDMLLPMHVGDLTYLGED